MKWYPNIYNEIIRALEAIFEEGRQADKYIQALLKKNKKWGSRDRKFVAKVLYDIVRWKRLYEYLAGTTIEAPDGKQRILSVWSLLNEVPLPDYLVFEDISLKSIEEKKRNLSDKSIEQSVPEWLFDKGAEQLGEDRWIQELEALNREAEVVIRVNRLKTDTSRLQKFLSKSGIQTHTDERYPDALFVQSRKKLTALPAYRQGLFEIQDASSQLVAPFAGARPGMTVIDACAGAGGKTLHLASLMDNKGKIFAYDIYKPKIEELLRRAKRNGVKNIAEAGLIDKKIIHKNREKADILLIDAPCSSLGTLRRKPGLKWELTPGKLQKINLIQKQIIDEYEKMLKPGGHLIYITCSVLPEENEKVINAFLNQHKNYTFVAGETIYPSAARGDGFYLAKLLKTNTNENKN